MSEESATTPKLRIDKWLWSARFFKTRSVAADAVVKNRVSVDGQRVKPSRTISPGCVIRIEKGPYEFEVTVLDLNDERRPASEAQALYAESEASIERRAELASRLRADRQARLGLAGEGRPNKKQRRQIIRFQNRNDADAAADDSHDD